ncbi:MAG: hypothetical protein A2X49_00670 [Lentisphaerae bacterium GWF2_52_8]|nr:MAG: hypothetical protein A2X49_00670 [Lentisphaerae bacterium GWF2_52_8]
MKISIISRGTGFFVVAAFAALFGFAAALAEDPPHIGYVYPAGGSQGSSFEVTVGGERIYDSQEASVSGKGVSVELLSSNASEAEKKKNANKKGAISQTAKFKVTISKDAECGERDFRVVSAGGISNKLNFQIGQLVEMNETEPNNRPDQVKKPIPMLPVTVNGQVMPGDLDLFKFSAKKGQSLVFEAEARSLIPYIADAVPSWLQVNLSILDSKGRELANSSDFRFEQDPVLFFNVPADGDYFLSVHDSIYRGREDFVYRVKMGELPFITQVYPLGGARGDAPANLKIYGKNLPSNSLSVKVPADAPSLMHISTRKGELTSNMVPFAAGDLPEVFEAKGNNSSGKAQRLSLPITVNGKIAAPGEKDFYSFEGKKGQNLYVEVLARRLGSPLDSGLALFNAKGERLKENDDQKDPSEGILTHHADSFISLTLPEDGLYTIRLCDIQGQGGDEFAYRLNLSLPRPDFSLRAEPANISVPKGGSASLNILAIRKDGFKGPIALGLSGNPKGFSLSGALIPEGRDRITLTVSASDEVPPGINNPAIEGTASINNLKVTHIAVPAENLMQAFIYRHSVPGVEQSFFVTQEAPFSIIAKLPDDKAILELPVGKEISIPVEIVRQPGKEFPVKLQLLNAPNGVTLRNGWIAADKSSLKLVIRTEVKTASNFKSNLIITGTAQVEKEEKIAEPPTKPEDKSTVAEKPQDKIIEKQITEKDSNNPAEKPGIKDNNKALPDVKEARKVKKEKFTVTAAAIPFVTVPEPATKKPHEDKDKKK